MISTLTKQVSNQGFIWKKISIWSFLVPSEGWDAFQSRLEVAKKTIKWLHTFTHQGG